jgi:hypothetical protein
MAAGGAVTRYFATLGFKVDKSELANIDRTLSNIEKKLRAFGKNIDKHLNITLKVDKVDIDKNKMRAAVGNTLDWISKNTVFEVSRFAVNDRALQAALTRANRLANGRMRQTTPATQPTVNPQVAPAQQTRPTRAEASYSRANYLHAGGAAGAFARYGAASLPFVGGVYGLTTLNQNIQELQSTEIAAGSIFGDRAQEAQKWLEQQADYVGFNYMETMPIFSSFMASGMPLMGYDQSKGVFQSLTEFGRTRGADAVSMKRAMYAIQQMAAKGQVMTEELKNQLSEAKGFGESRQIFAEAYQIQTGGSLTGQEASAALIDAMQKGQVKSADILPIVARLMSERAAGGLEAARTSLTAEQMRFQNEQTRQLRAFTEAGGSSGFARLFRSMTVALKEGQPLIEGMARAFDEMSKYAAFVFQLPQSFKRAFEGRDSWVADMMGEANVQIAKDFYEGLKELAGAIKETLGIALDGWKLIFETFGDDFLGFIVTIKDVLLYSFKIINSAIKGDLDAASRFSDAMFASMMGADAETVKAIAEGKPTPAMQNAGNVNPMQMAVGALTGLQNLPRAEGLMEVFTRAGAGFDYQRQYDKARNIAVNDPTSVYYMNPKGFDLDAQHSFRAAMDSNYTPDQGTGLAPTEINVTVQAVPGREVDAEATGNVIATKIKEALQFFTEK